MTMAKKLRRSYRILVINPGSTSTKVAFFHRSRAVSRQTIQHPSEEIAACEKVVHQINCRLKSIDDFLTSNGLIQGGIDAISCRGGMLRPLSGGAYKVNEKMCNDLMAARYGEHASNLGPLLAYRLAEIHCVPVFTVDPVTVDEFDPSSRITGVPGLERKCRCHALNIKAAARRYANESGKVFGETNLVVAHLGGGISICALRKGKIVDSTDGLLGEGPFSLERAGALPLAVMLDLCFESSLSKEKITSLLARESGFKGYLNIDRLPQVFEAIDKGNKEAGVILEAMVRQVIKWIGGMIALVGNSLDSVILTGGMINSRRLVRLMLPYIEHMAKITVYPGESEMMALAEGALRVLMGEEAALEY